MLGICGGYQMLGRLVSDPKGIEGPPCSVDGLGLLEVETVLEGDKVLVEVAGQADGVPFKGYEMHVGRTSGAVAPMLRLPGHDQGAVSGRVSGCYVHGLFTDDRTRAHLLKQVGAQASGFAYESEVEKTLDKLADHLGKHVDCGALLSLSRG